MSKTSIQNHDLNTNKDTKILRGHQISLQNMNTYNRMFDKDLDTCPSVSPNLEKGDQAKKLF